MGKAIESKKCELCGLTFFKPTKCSQSNWDKRRFCSCDCSHKSRVVDLTGQRFGRLVAVEATERRNGNCAIVWRCLCNCGNEHFAASCCLRNGHTKSCGCLQKEQGAQNGRKSRTTHGMSKSAEYEVWKAMNQRCKNSNNKDYKNYGGRGIKVCERWSSSFEAFYEDMGPCPEGMSIDRRDNDSGYTPKNCRYTTDKKQANNRRSKSCGPYKQQWFLAFNTNTGEWFEDNNQRNFAGEHELCQANISACLHGKQKTLKGWTFEFLPYQA